MLLPNKCVSSSNGDPNPAMTSKPSHQQGVRDAETSNADKPVKC